MYFTSCTPMTNTQRAEYWREQMLHELPDLTEEDCLRQIRTGLELRSLWNLRFERSARSSRTPPHAAIEVGNVHYLSPIAA